MERRKIPKVEQLGQVLNTKNRLNSCLGVCFLTSILTFYFILPADIAGARTKSISIFSWFSSSPGSDGGVWNVPVGGHSMDRGRRKGGGDLEEKNTTTITTTFGTNVTTKITPVVPPEKPSVNVTMLVQPENPSANVTKKTTTLVRPEMGGVSENPEANVTTKITHLVQPEKVPKEVPKCDIFDGRWVKDERIKPYYSHRSCPYMDIDFNCHKNGRPDHEFLKWRWQPYGCTIPILNATDFLERMRGKRLIFVGDSLNRNMWESLVCILRQSIPNKKNVHEISGRMQFKTAGYYEFKFKDYDCSIDFVRSTFLVRNVYVGDGKDDSDERLRLDLLDDTTRAYRKADVIVFNTGHWWTHEKTSKGVNYYQEGNHVHPFLDVSEAYERALTTWARWIDRNIDSKKTQLFFRGYSPTHFRGGQWNSGGKCHKEIDPIRNDTYLDKYPSKMAILDKVLKRMKTPVVNLNITRLSDYRKDGHPSIYRKRYDSVEQQVVAEASQDCSHWCLPGLPDTWNQLLYASLLVNAKGSWKD